jgi:vacuolar-type H+-ATPase subunit I/STV1
VLNAIHFFAYFTKVIFLLATFILCCINFFRQKSKLSFSILFGMFLCVFAFVWQLINPIYKGIYNDKGVPIESFEPSHIWYIGSIFYSAGLIIILICLVIMAIQRKGVF